MVKADNLVVRYDGLGILVWASGLGDGLGAGRGIYYTLIDVMDFSDRFV